MDARLLCLWDANLNRTREGIRVVEDLARFVFRDEKRALELKRLRHAITSAARSVAPESGAVLARAIGKDVGAKHSLRSEGLRETGHALLEANFNRAAEALRCLEEAAKLVSAAAGKKFKAFRFRLYAAEEKLMARALRLERLRKFHDAALYVVLDSRQFPKGLGYEHACGTALAGGAQIIQLRDKLLKGRQLLAVAKKLAARCRTTGALFIVNDRADIALACGADGVHLGQEDLPVQEARCLLGPDKLIGKSTHSLPQARGAVREGADYLSVGPVYATPSKPGATAVGPQLVRQVSARLPVPFVAIGGLDASNVGLVLDAGARTVGVIRAVVAAKNPAKAARRLTRLVKKKRKKQKRWLSAFGQ